MKTFEAETLLFCIFARGFPYPNIVVAIFFQMQVMVVAKTNIARKKTIPIAFLTFVNNNFAKMNKIITIFGAINEEMRNGNETCNFTISSKLLIRNDNEFIKM